MEGPLERRPKADPALLRVSDADRHHVADILRQAAGEGRLDLEELEQRLEAAYAAKTYADLVPLTFDLPVAGQEHLTVPQPRPAESLLPAVRHDSTISVLGGVRRTGVWELGEKHTALAVCAGIELDLRQARFTSGETVIHVNAIWASMEIIVNESTHVVVDGIGIMGGFDHARDKVEPRIGPDSPVVRVEGAALMATVTVQRRPMPGASSRRRMFDH